MPKKLFCYGFNLHQQIRNFCRIYHHREVFTGIKGSQIYLKGASAIYEAIGADADFTVAPIIVAVPDLSTAQIAG